MPLSPHLSCTHRLLAKDAADDWSGVTDPVFRKKLQNRLNQRAYRYRKQIDHRRTQTSVAIIGEKTPADHEFKQFEIAHSRHRNVQFNMNGSRLVAWQQGCLLLIDSVSRKNLLRFARMAYENYSINSPRPTQLQPLIRLNILNAMAQNAGLLGFDPYCMCADELVSPFNRQRPNEICFTNWSTVPLHLRPTRVQLSIPHHPWLDLFPIPKLRDRVLLAMQAQQIDEDDLCVDLSEMYFDDAEKPALIVWGKPWDLRGWEATIPFLRKWGWLVKDCPEILESTNAWREMRGERRISW